MLYMLERWDAWPRGIRWLVGIAAVALALAILWALLVPVTDWLARHDVGSVNGPPLRTARDAARGRLLTLGAGLFAAGALVFTARNFVLSREGQVTDRYTKAIEQLGSDKLDVRIGGIYSLERVARDSARDHPTVMEVLSAFVREHSHEPWPPSGPGGQEQARSTRTRLGLAIWTRTTRNPRREQARSTRPDVQAAVTVIGRRDAKRDIDEINLCGANLTGAILMEAHLAVANLGGANLTHADLTHADLTHANLEGADLFRAILGNVDLSSARLRGADLGGADLAGAILAVANFDGANLDDANLDDARWLGNTPVPEGWKLDTDSGRLKRAGTGSGRPRVPGRARRGI